MPEMYRKISVISVTCLLLVMAAGCIKNDIPYPRRLGKITAFEVQGQIGKTVVDSVARTVSVDVADTVDLARVRLVRFEVSDGTAVSPSPDSLAVLDLTEPFEFVLSTYPGQNYLWTVTAEYAEEQAPGVDAWATVAYVKDVLPSVQGTPGIRWRRADTDQWQESTDLTLSGDSASVVLRGLTPATAYVYRMYAADKEGPEVSFMTEEARQMPNMSFDEWNTTGGIVYPNADQEENAWWDSGNTGARLGGKVPTSQETEFLAVPGEGKSAVRMETVNAIIAMAGGNIFSGSFGSIQGLGAEVFFGRPFDTRPLRLTGYYSYEPQVINNVKAPQNVPLPFDASTIMGRMDRCCIFVYVTDWDGPFRVNTTEHVYLDINDPHVIGYGQLVDSVGTGGEYRQFTVDIKYRSHRKPTYCAVVAVASQYADFFTGGIGSLMYADEFAFEYDGEAVWEEGYR